MNAAPWSAMSSDEKLEALLVDLAAMAKSMRRWAETLDRLAMPGSASVRCLRRAPRDLPAALLGGGVMSVASDLKVLREATADELRVTGPGRKSQFDPIVAELAGQLDSPAVPPAPAWRPEGLPAGTWSSLTPRDRERAAVAVARAPKALRAVAIAELEVPVDVLEQTMKLLRNKGIIG